MSSARGSDAWRSYRGAPAIGRTLCALDDLPDGGTRAMTFDGFPALFVRKGQAVRAFVNACPHQYLPLDHKGDRLLSADGAILRCTNHSAGFSAETGEGVEGLGLGACLDPIPVTVRNDGVVVVG